MSAGDVRNVIVLNDYCHVNGGASKIAIDEAVGLAAAGLNVFFLGATGPVCDTLRESAVQVFCLEQPELLQVGKNPAVVLQGLWNIPAHKRMRALLALLNPGETIVHLHGYTKSLTTSPVCAAVENGFRVVCTLHDFFAACPNGAFFDYPENRPCGRRALSFDCVTANCDKRHYVHKLYRVGRSVVQRHFGELPAGVMDYISLSRRSVAILREYLPADATYHPLENLIEVAHLPPVEVAANARVVVVGRLDVEKGIESVLEASAIAGVEVTFVGDGPMRGMVERHAHARVTGWIASADVQNALAGARCLVFPSLWYETFGLVVSEAAARGVPAIVSDISAASERLEHGREGWIFPAGDVAALSHCLSLTKDDATLRQAGLAAYARFWNAPPTRDNHIAGLQRIYAQMMGAQTIRAQMKGARS